jgi:prepilin-type N-terminal cleavage/methylation domain-containing protein
MSIWRARTRGFTLIEMAIVMVVIGLVVSGGIVAARPIIEGSKTTETKAKLDRIESALLLHAIRFGCLPCPATANGTGNTAGQAVDSGTNPYTSDCVSGCSITATSQGIVPWRNLDLSEADIVDGYGTRISYALGGTTALSAANSMNRNGSNYAPTGLLTVNNTAGTTITSAAAYVLVSHGINRIYGYQAYTGAQFSSDPNNSTPELANSNGSPFVQNDRVDASGATHFDDIVRWRTKPIITQLCGDGSCGNPS